MSPHYRKAYKTLFAHPEIVRDLLLEFTDTVNSEIVDFDTLSPVDNSYTARPGHTQDGDTAIRRCDTVWKVRLADEPVYIYILLALQPTSDEMMALRMLQYVAFLLNNLKERNELTPNGKLPPVLPVVLYYGSSAWRAALEFTEMLVPSSPDVQALQFSQRYLLIDVSAQSDAELKKSANLAALWFRLQHAQHPEEVRKVLIRLQERLAGEEHAALRHDFSRVITWQLRHCTNDPTIRDMSDLSEVQRMLEERQLEWAQQWLREAA